MKKEDVGKFYTTDGKDIWRLISYCEYPTATMENVETKERINGAVGCLNLKPFKRLVVATEDRDD